THDPNLGKGVPCLPGGTIEYPKPLRLPINTMICYDALRERTLVFSSTVDTMWTPFQRSNRLSRSGTWVSGQGYC
ncbi:MAG: hypothetical protein WB820_12570, partial [Rhodoplanes sp.]